MWVLRLMHLVRCRRRVSLRLLTTADEVLHETPGPSRVGTVIGMPLLFPVRLVCRFQPLRLRCPVSRISD